MDSRETPVEGGFILADAALSPESGWFEPDYWRRAGEGRPLGRGRGVAVSAGRDGQWVLRHYHRGGLPGRLIHDEYVWLGRRAARPVQEFRVLAALLDSGAPVPRPVAARVRRAGMLYRGDILVERVAGAQPLAEIAATLPAARWTEVGRAIRRFHEAGGWHADLNANNILLAPDAVALIDLDRGRSDCTSPHRQSRNLDRLLRSLRKLGLMPVAESGWQALIKAYEAANES